MRAIRTPVPPSACCLHQALTFIPIAPSPLILIIDIMSQDLYKRKGHNWRDSRREEAVSKRSDDRYQHLVQHFRNIDLQDLTDDETDGDLSLLPTQLQQSIAELAVTEEDWDNPKPVVDLRTFNFSLPGILCPFCRQNVMQQDVTGLLLCSCSSTLKTRVPIQVIKQAIQDVVLQHGTCPSNQSPDYTMFKSHIVLTCTVCALVHVVS